MAALVFIALHELSQVAASGAPLCGSVGFSWSFLLLQNTGSGCMGFRSCSPWALATGSVVEAHGLSCSKAFGVFPDQGLNPPVLAGRPSSTVAPGMLIACSFLYILQSLCQRGYAIEPPVTSRLIFGKSLTLNKADYVKGQPYPWPGVWPVLSPYRLLTARKLVVGKKEELVRGVGTYYSLLQRFPQNILQPSHWGPVTAS